MLEGFAARSLRWLPVALLLGAPVLTPVAAQPPGRARPNLTEQQLTTMARGIHDRVIALDTHVDIEPGRMSGPDAYYNVRTPGTKVDLVKMQEGGLDAVFFSIYVGQGPLTPDGYAYANRVAMSKFAAERIAPDKIGIALTAADVRRINASGRKVALMGVENAYSLGNDIRNVKVFYDMGARYMSLAHNGNSQYADSHDGNAACGASWGGVSPAGKEVIAEMNRWGIMIDVSHPSKATMLQSIALSKAPIIGSHSAVMALGHNSRDMDDEQLLALAKNGGVIQIVAYPGFIKQQKDSPARVAAINALRREYGVDTLGTPAAPATPTCNLPGGALPLTATPQMPGAQGARGGAPAAPAAAPAAAGRAGGAGRGGAPAPAGRAGAPAAPAPAPAPAAGGRGGAGAAPGSVNALSPARRAEYDRRLADIDARMPADPPGNLKDFVDNIDYAVKLIGVDHVGISSDFDGGGGVVGWNDASETFNVTLELVRRGYTEEEISKIWSGNLLRVMEQVEQVAQKIQAGQM